MSRTLTMNKVALKLTKNTLHKF